MKVEGDALREEGDVVQQVRVVLRLHVEGDALREEGDHQKDLLAARKLVEGDALREEGDGAHLNGL